MASLLADLLTDLGAAFNRTSARWYIFGAQAAIVYGTARLTADVDVTVMFGNQPVENLIQALKDEGFETRITDALSLVEQSRVLPVVHLLSGIPVDIVFGGPGLEEQFAHRAQNHKLDGVMVPIASSEDIITMKILAGRGKDLDDALAIIMARGKQLDLQTIGSTLELLEKTLDRSDLLRTLDDLVHRGIIRE